MPDRLIDARELRAGKEELRVAFQAWRGMTSLHVRRWYRDAGGELRPGKGLTVHPSLIPWLRRALERAEAAALELDLLAEEDYELVDRALPPSLTGREA